MRRPVLVVFDVAADGRRNQVRGAIQRLGWAYQRSGWILRPSPTVTVDFVFEGLATLTTQTDRLLVVEPCVDCLRQSFWVPEAHAPWPASFVVV